AQEVNHMIIFFLVSLQFSYVWLQFSYMDASVGELGKKGHQSLLLLNELSQHAALLGNIGSLYNERSKEDPETGYDWCLLKNEHEKHAHDGDQEIEGENEMNNFMLFLLHTNSIYLFLMTLLTEILCVSLLFVVFFVVIHIRAIPFVNSCMLGLGL
ncbi:hypothetical protein ACJX0J_037010, partial [Zea mays]